MAVVVAADAAVRARNKRRARLLRLLPLQPVLLLPLMKQALKHYYSSHTKSFLVSFSFFFAS